ncbi:hypothetical protein [Daejeonella sp. H1SJ63]|uniref:hypothetical protein n=1 Tax=Daejeonella sp. H1SJ63 TaxID=3034145 RepID=UPI0023EB4C43|nr:hypothetical protein [Daejeonella sp. H1SJ63]
MGSIINNILVVLAACFLGSLVNMGIIMVGGSIIPPPDGADITNMEGLRASMHLFGPRHFLMPFVAHAIGTFTGAFVAAKFATGHQMKFAMGISAFFLAGGIANVYMLPGPLWFSIVDLSLAYIPMAYFAGKLAIKKTDTSN